MRVIAIGATARVLQKVLATWALDFWIPVHSCEWLGFHGAHAHIFDAIAGVNWNGAKIYGVIGTTDAAFLVDFAFANKPVLCVANAVFIDPCQF